MRCYREMPIDGEWAAYDGMHALLPDDAAAGRQVRDILRKKEQKVLSSGETWLDSVFCRFLMPPPSPPTDF